MKDETQGILFWSNSKQKNNSKKSIHFFQKEKPTSFKLGKINFSR